MILLTATVLEMGEDAPLNTRIIVSEVAPVSTRERLAASMLKHATGRALELIMLADTPSKAAAKCNHSWALCAHTEPEWRPVYKCDKCGTVRAA